jgi:intracellular multiplication protein IcmG
MADNDQNDEYQFSELDSDNESMDNANYGSSESQSTGQKPTPPKKDVKRNALIAVGLIIFTMLMYKLIGGMFSGKSANETAKGTIPPAPIAEVVPPRPQAIQPIQPAQPVVAVQQVQENNSVLKEKVEAIETNQQNVQSQVSSMSEQVGNVNNNVTNLSAQISTLNQTITDLTNQLSRQSEEINVLMERTRPKPVRRVIRPHHVGQANIYYINAVIPGRAWLIGTNGSTLTVREGTTIAGYGVVKLIDSMAGRVLTSSGRIIRFSQDDS